MKKLKWLGVGTIVSSLCLLLASVNSEAGVSVNTAGKSHIGTFDGSTTFTTSSSNGINPGLFIEVRDKDGKLKQYTSEEGVVTVPNTKEGAYVTQAKLLGKTKYVDQDTGEILDEWEEGRNLKLESSKMPVLTTTGKNLFNGEVVRGYINDAGMNSGATDWVRTDYFPVEANTDYYFSVSPPFDNANLRHAYLYDENKKYLGRTSQSNKFRPSTNGFVRCVSQLNGGGTISDEQASRAFFQIARGTVVSPYEPYKTNILTVNEEVELRGIGDVKDELNLLTGELTQRIEEVMLDGSEEGWVYEAKGSATAVGYIPYYFTNPPTNAITNYFSLIETDLDLFWGANQDYEMFCVNDMSLAFKIEKTKLKTPDSNGIKEWLSQNNLIIQYDLATPIIKTVDLNATYQFNLISDSVVQIKGEALPTIYSITVPSEPLTFTINPNAEEGQKFIAPDFSITNESQGPVFLELKSFEQTTSVFNDVLPEEHEDWVQLTKDESKDIALALVPINSDGWLTLNEGEKYVATSQNIELGGIRAGATVDFSFNAYHGRVFDQNLFPEYRLVFTFGF